MFSMLKPMILIRSVIARSDSDDAISKTGLLPASLALAVAMTVVMTVVLTLLAMPLVYANDADVYSVSLQNYRASATPKTVDVQFFLAQKNVFPAGLTDANSATYNDRLWVFVKYFNTAWAANTAWKHATLVSGGSVGTFSGGVGITSDGKGAFCRTGVNQTLRWAVGTDETGIDGTQTFKVRVFAIEMVLIPTGPFWVGSGGVGGYESDSFTDGSWVSGASIPFTITSESAITINTGAGNLWSIANEIGSAGTLPAEFPKGYQAFYIMKYELTQGQYTDFLNTLTREQQQSRIGTAISAGDTSVTNIYVMSNKPSTTDTYRNTIVCPASISANVPITFSTTTPYRACNFLAWADLCAYADWAGLRPMTELEFEKACRGGSSTSNVLANEYAWGTTNKIEAVTLVNDGTATEGVTETGNGLYSYNSGVAGPLRVGFAATASTTREQAGASYYGVMELSGNLWERAVTVGNSDGRLFTGLHGDGALDSSGNANVTYWPSVSTASGSGFRGGTWGSDYNFARVSFRAYAAGAYPARSNSYGGRLARTSP